MKYLCLVQDIIDKNDSKFYFKIIESDDVNKLELTYDYSSRIHMAYTCNNIDLLNDIINNEKYKFFTCCEKYIYGEKEKIILFMNKLYRENAQNKN